MNYLPTSSCCKCELLHFSSSLIIYKVKLKMLKYIILSLISICISIGIWQRTNPPLKLPDLPNKDELLLMPLDSRPVCSTMVQKLGKIAGINVIVPPKELLDNYQEPANSKKLWHWLQMEAPSKKASIISADILLHGSLLQTRQHLASAGEQDAFFQELNLLEQKIRTQEAWLHENKRQDAPQKRQLSLFSVIPRLLVSDEVYPDCWYQWHLMRYSQLLDMVAINGDFAMTKELLEYREEIPVEILQKYTGIFEQSQMFNRKLLETLSHFKAVGKAPQSRKINAGTPRSSDAGSADAVVVIGQDDSSPFGLPQLTALALERQIEAHGLEPQAQITHGADEIATLLLARHYLQQANFQPQIFLHYGTPKTEFKHMPYMAASVGATLRNQIQLIGAQLVEQPQQSQIVLFVHCGDDDIKPTSAEAQQLSSYLQQGKHVALIDLSANFEAEEMLLPQLLRQQVPINRLVAYAGWNTFSNSSGTALAQSCFFTGRLRELSGTDAGVNSTLIIQSSLPTSKDTRANDISNLVALYAANLNFTVERMLEDFFYQKLIHPELRPYLESFGTTPTALEPAEKLETEHFIHQRLSFYAAKLLWQSLGNTPFYSDAQHSYYLSDLRVGARLPWNRIFEVDLNVHSKVQRVPNH